MSEQILLNIHNLIAAAKQENKKHITVYDRSKELEKGGMPVAIVEQLKTDGYGIYRHAAGECTIISWGMPTGKTSGRVNMKVIIESIKSLAGNCQNIFTI